MKNLYTVLPYDAKTQRVVTRVWTKLKTGSNRRRRVAPEPPPTPLIVIAAPGRCGHALEPRGPRRLFSIERRSGPLLARTHGALKDME